MLRQCRLPKATLHNEPPTFGGHLWCNTCGALCKVAFGKRHWRSIQAACGGAKLCSRAACGSAHHFSTLFSQKAIQADFTTVGEPSAPWSETLCNTKIKRCSVLGGCNSRCKESAPPYRFPSTPCASNLGFERRCKKAISSRFFTE